MNLSRTAFARSALAAAGAAAATTCPRFPAGAAEYEFRCGADIPVEHDLTPIVQQMGAALERESGGRIRFQFFPAGQLGNMTAMLSQLRLGALHFVLTSPGNLAGIVPTADITSVGFAFKDADDGLRAMDGALGYYVRNQIAAQGIYVFREFWEATMTIVGSNTHPIRTPEDLRGFKLRINASKIAVDLFKELGASPTTIGYSEVYTALQTRLIDGESLPLALLAAARLNEVNKYASLTNHTWAAFWMLANGDVWKRLPADLQAIVQTNNTKYGRLGQQAAKTNAASLTAKLEKLGLQFNPVDQGPFRARLKAYYGELAAAFGPTAWSFLEAAVGRKLS